MTKFVDAIAAALFALVTTTPLARADDLPQPQGEVILTVSGRIRHSNGPDATARFDAAMLQALSAREGTMETPWTPGRVTFKGPLGRAVLDAVGADGDVVRVIAINDYAATLPITDLTQHDTILATTMNGNPMSIRDKGPIFIIYPFDREPALYNELYFGRSVWQVKAMVVQ